MGMVHGCDAGLRTVEWMLIVPSICRRPCPRLSSSPPSARFSPDDKFSKERVTIKKRFNILPTQGAPIKY